MEYKILEFLVIFVIIFWTFVWKIYSVWISAKNGHRIWFIFLVFFNTLGILDMIYIFFVLKKSIKEVKKDLFNLK